ncbi:L-threonylcarbamoyladenylate synthase [Nocardioides sp. B-3]|uniref:L-threonylcarbamoyladenylate synthase n=1 Tax=Nocardioides sp. B-3 TaxID=2895565 RepID=UPI002152D912|nr:Sua5/YciO/YrdC/YwlC family protein [Nocardioides sp. B-3]
MTTDDEREAAIEAAAPAIRRGELIVLPTDTVYGIAADAFSPDAVKALLAAKGRGREMPPPVLVSAATTLDALAVGVPSYARAPVAEFWPGALTVVCRQQSSLQWDSGETRGTVAVRMPDDQIAPGRARAHRPAGRELGQPVGAPGRADCRRGGGDAR